MTASRSMVVRWTVGSGLALLAAAPILVFSKPPASIPRLSTRANRITIAPSGVVLLNGTPMTMAKLKIYLTRTQRMKPIPELHLQPDPKAPYSVVDQVLAITQHAGISKMGFVGNEAYDPATDPVQPPHR